MNLDNISTIIAPSALHLPVYEAVLAARGDCCGLNVISMTAWQQEQLVRTRQPKLPILYEYARLLEDLPEDNVFYESRRDYDFLESCRKFMPLLAMYSISLQPGKTDKERSLWQIIERLQSVELWQQQALALPVCDLSHVGILKRNLDWKDQFWADRLCLQGAKMLGERPESQTVHYWSAANPRKMMEAAADAIVEIGLDAQSVMVALADPLQRQVFCQIFDSRKIPYSFLHDDSATPVIAQWKACLEYVMHPDEAHLNACLQTLFPRTSADVLRWRRLQPDSLEHLSYQPCALLDEEEFVRLQNLEVSARNWSQVIEGIRSWTIESMDQIALLIQEANPDPQEVDIRAFEGVIDAWLSIRDQVHTPKDLDLFVRSLDSLSPMGAPAELRGVIVGGLHDLCGLRENVFVLGVSASNFPGNAQERGIFNEEFLSSLPLPDLAKRMEQASKSAFEAMDLAKELYILCPQADYEGKSIEPCHEISAHYGMLPEFQRVRESSIQTRPGFDLGADEAARLYLGEDNVLKTRVRSIDTYTACPLKNLLSSGLHLHAPFALREELQVNVRELCTWLMARARDEMNLPLSNVPAAVIHRWILENFSFAARIFPKRRREIERLASEYTRRILIVFGRMDVVGSVWGMDMVSSDYVVEKKQRLDDLNMEVEVGGTLNSTSSRQASINLYYKDPNGGFAALEYPQATLNFSLQPAAKNYDAFSLSYGRGASTPVSANANSVEKAVLESQKDFFKQSIVGQRLENLSDPIGESIVKSRAKNSYQDKDEALMKQAAGLAKSVRESRFLPEHAKDACVRCPYRTICRNAAFERGSRKESQS